jgi:glycosyl transferase family 87
MSSTRRLILAELLFSLTVFALQKVPRGWGGTTLVLVCLIIAALPLLLVLARGSSAAPSRTTGRLLTWGIAILASAQLAFACAMLVKPKVLDIGETTLAAALATVAGHNPYAMPIDAAGGGIADADRFHGYKYLPMMIVAYAPLSLALGIRGIIVTNIVLQAVTAVLARSIAQRIAGRFAGLAAALLYLSLPFVAHQVFTRGVTDLAPVVMLLAALRFADERPGWAGLMVGLSIATKLIPGVVMLPCALPARGQRRRYALGVLAGLLAIVPFAATAPDAFVANVVLFNLVRPIDDTSWLLGLSPVAIVTARAAAVAVLAAIAVRIWRRAPRLDERCLLATLAILAVFAVGPGMHHNYYLWFLPLLAILAASASLGAAAATDAR